jgi:dihydrofolate reductase
MRAMIWAESPEGVIGAGGTLPWRYPGDLRRFKRLTLGSTVVMGRTTFASMRNRPLPERRNILVTSGEIDVAGVEVVRSIGEALVRAGDADVWFIGGARIYAEGMRHVDLIDVAYVPDHVVGPELVRAPVIDEHVFEASALVPHEDEPALTRRTYRRR